jgi:hypothetical protein
VGPLFARLLITCELRYVHSVMVSTGVAVPEKEWRHIAVTVVANRGRLTVYRDGGLAFSTSITLPGGSVAGTSDLLMMQG